MKKIIVLAVIAALSISNFGAVSASHHWEKMNSWEHNMMHSEWEYGMFTDMVRGDLTMDEKIELKESLEKQKTGMAMVKATVMKIKAWELNNFEEFAKIAPKRKAMIGKLKVFMKDPMAFEAMCMKHWNKLIANIFTDEKIVSKYKMILEKKAKSQIEKLYAKKWAELEKILHKAMHKNINSKNIKNISLLRAIDLIIQDIKSPEFGVFTKFAKKDLSKIERTALKELIAEREKARGKFKKMLTDAKANGTFEETFKIVQNKRAGCQARFSLYLDETKKEEFEAHCKKMGEGLKAKFQ